MNPAAAPRATPVPGAWRRVRLAEHPPGVTVAQVPFLGTSWLRRGPAYWLRRLGCLLLSAGMVAVQLVWWLGALADDAKGGGLDAAGWATLAAGVLATAEGLRMVLFRQGIPFFRLWSDPVVRYLYLLPLLAYLLFVVVLLPGLFLSLLIEGLRPRLGYEEIARADLEAQLRAR
ncbi:hypothetical protein ACFYNO_07775 [Kitasatospora sp. NPDC006697]|uniref:hypothetical protein n=1 Tax=Kitasatospora sp. NPDC006697 TaxID=3364020 RepID=UPI0036BEC4BD